MTSIDRDALRELETAIYDVRDWGEAVHLAATGLPDEVERAALQKLGRTIASLGESLRDQFCEAAGYQRVRS